MKKEKDYSALLKPIGKWVKSCRCKIPEPIIKNSENGISSYCGLCSKQII